jgi:hypothetical protein
VDARGDDVVALQRDGGRHAERAVVRLERGPDLGARILDRARLVDATLDAVCPASSRTVTVIRLPGLLFGPLVTGKITEPLAGPLAITSPSSRRSTATASALAV